MGDDVQRTKSGSEEWLGGQKVDVLIVNCATCKREIVRVSGPAPLAIRHGEKAATCSGCAT